MYPNCKSMYINSSNLVVNVWMKHFGINQISSAFLRFNKAICTYEDLYTVLTYEDAKTRWEQWYPLTRIPHSHQKQKGLQI